MRCRSWEEFFNRALEVMVESPATVRYVMKYMPSKKAFTLKVTDGQKIVTKCCPKGKVTHRHSGFRLTLPLHSVGWEVSL